MLERNEPISADLRDFCKKVRVEVGNCVGGVYICIYKYVCKMSEKKNITLSIDTAIKKQFQAECVMNEVEMSETVEQMMENYVKTSQEIRQNIKVDTNGNDTHS